MSTYKSIEKIVLFAIICIHKIKYWEKTLGSQYDTEMGGGARRFSTTCWTVIIDSQTTDEDRKQLILDELFQKYWKPIYWYIRKKGNSNDKAKDLTQGFFAEIVWGRDLIQSADPEKGRFRNFLVTALERYLTDTWRYEHSQKRMPSKQIFSYSSGDFFELADIEEEIGPEEVFNSVWIMDILQQSLLEVREEMEDDGKGVYWTLFENRCLKPILEGTKSPSLSELCQEFKIQDVTKASNMIVTAKRRVKKVIIQNIRKLVHSQSDLEKEVSLLLGKLLF